MAPVTFGLVPAAWHGAWCWDLLAAELEARGQAAVGVDLPNEDPACGAREAAAIVAGALEPAGADVVVVGHSLGGLTIPLVPALRPVKLLVFLCGFLPQPGTSMKEQVRDQQVFAPAYAALARRQTRLPDGSSRWPPDAAIEVFYPDCPPQLASWAASKLGRQVWTIFDETTPLEAWPPVGAVSILCREDRVVSPDWSRRVSTERLGRPAVELDGGHSPFLSRPAELADLLVALSA